MDDNFYVFDEDFDLEEDDVMEAAFAFNPEDDDELMLAQRPQTGRPPMGQPPMGQPPMGQPPMGQPQYGRPQYGRPQYGRPPYGRYDQGRYGRDRYEGYDRRDGRYLMSPPPSYIPRRPYPYRNPYPLRQCLYGFNYLWMDDGRSFWARLTSVDRGRVDGYRWNGYRWIPFTANVRDIENYVCL